MIKSVTCSALSAALKKLKETVAENEAAGARTVIFCEDRLTLAAERTVCAAVGGTFNTFVFTLARFLTTVRGRKAGVLSAQGSAMVVRKIIDDNRSALRLFKKFSAASAAQSVYDTIALLYASGVDPEDLDGVQTGGLLENKLHDIAFLYKAYSDYLKESGKTDRNAYLRELPAAVSESALVKGARVIFLAFQSFTRSSLDCVKAAFGVAKSVTGIFVGGDGAAYLNEARAAFVGAAKPFGGARNEYFKGDPLPEAAAFSRGLFDPESFYGAKKLGTDRVRISEAADEREEFEFIAAEIKRRVLDEGFRYGEISVMLPDVEKAERELAHVFAEYCIPYYADRRRKLGDHFVAEFVINYLTCAAAGCRPQDVDGVISSPLFLAPRQDKEEWRNYALKYADFRGGVKKQPNARLLEGAFDCEAVSRVRQTFLDGLELLSLSSPKAACDGVYALFELFKVKERAEELYEKFRDERPAEAEFCQRAPEGVLAVINEAGLIAGQSSISPLEFIKILKSGLSAAEISLIPPKADAVFVGDLSATANTGSRAVFAARLTGDVPDAGADTALLTDREITALENANLVIAPKIRQVNLRRRELLAQNLCAFNCALYLSYPARLGGEEKGVSEIIDYAKAVFTTPKGGELAPIPVKKLMNYEQFLPYCCSEKLPAAKRLARYGEVRASVISAIYFVLCSHGYADCAQAAIQKEGKKTLSSGKRLYTLFGNLSPTELEAYFRCPYRAFLEKGLRLEERRDSSAQGLTVGNFIHEVLRIVVPETAEFETLQQAAERAKVVAAELLSKPPYSELAEGSGGEYAFSSLVEEAASITAGSCEQLINSSFAFRYAEKNCSLDIGGITVEGRIDRVDVASDETYGDMVRVIDYKSGSASGEAADYYMGKKLQLPLYLLSESKEGRAVGAYYFPASVKFSTSDEDISAPYRLRGFMDCSAEVVQATDRDFSTAGKSRFIEYKAGSAAGSVMDRETFSQFLGYASLVAAGGAEEMFSGYITPSPVENACDYCKMKGSCGFSPGDGGAVRQTPRVNCKKIAAIVAQKEESDESDR